MAAMQYSEAIWSDSSQSISFCASHSCSRREIPWRCKSLREDNVLKQRDRHSVSSIGLPGASIPRSVADQAFQALTGGLPAACRQGDR